MKVFIIFAAIVIGPCPNVVGRSIRDFEFDPVLPDLVWEDIIDDFAPLPTESANPPTFDTRALQKDPVKTPAPIVSSNLDLKSNHVDHDVLADNTQILTEAVLSKSKDSSSLLSKPTTSNVHTFHKNSVRLPPPMFPSESDFESGRVFVGELTADGVHIPTDAIPLSSADFAQLMSPSNIVGKLILTPSVIKLLDAYDKLKAADKLR